jgi:hypothetical protein
MTLEPLRDDPLEFKKDTEEQRQQRLKAVAELASMNVEDVPDPDELSRQLNEKYDWSWMYGDENDRG